MRLERKVGPALEDVRFNLLGTNSASGAVGNLLDSLC